MLSTVALFVFCFSIPVSLLKGSLPLQTIVNKCWCFHLFFKVCTKGYVVNSYLANPDNEAVSYSATSSTNSWASWGAVMLELKQLANSTAVMYTRKSLISSVTQSILRPQQMFIKLNKCAWTCLDTPCDRQPTLLCIFCHPTTHKSQLAILHSNRLNELHKLLVWVFNLYLSVDSCHMWCMVIMQTCINTVSTFAIAVGVSAPVTLIVVVV